MSELTRYQVRVLLQRAAELHQQSLDIRSELDALMAQISRAGISAGDVSYHEAPAKKKIAK